MTETTPASITAVSPDANVERVRAKLLERSQAGLKKYGVTTERDDLNLLGWMQHLQEELMDAAIYIERIMNDLRRVPQLFEGRDPLYSLAAIELELELHKLEQDDGK